MRLENEAQIGALYEAVQASGHELLLEIIPPRDRASAADDDVYRAMKRLYNLGIYPEWWKLAPMPPSQWKAIDALIAERDPHCRGVLVLGLNAGVEALAAGFRDARSERALPRLRRRAHDLPGAVARLARRRDRRRGARGAASARRTRR